MSLIHRFLGITSGLRGGKLIFDNDDLHVFEASHPKFRGAGGAGLAMTAQPTLDRIVYKVRSHVHLLDLFFFLAVSPESPYQGENISR